MPAPDQIIQHPYLEDPYHSVVRLWCLRLLTAGRGFRVLHNGFGPRCTELADRSVDIVAWRPSFCRISVTACRDRRWMPSGCFSRISIRHPRRHRHAIYQSRCNYEDRE